MIGECGMCTGNPNQDPPVFYYTKKLTSTGERGPKSAAQLAQQFMPLLDSTQSFLKHNLEMHNGQAVLVNFSFQIVGPKQVRTVKMKK